MALGGQRHAGSHLGVVGDVGAAEQHPIAQLVRQGLSGLGIDVGHHHPHPSLVQCTHHPGTDEGGAPGHDRALAAHAFKSLDHADSCAD
ncbi:hypothetical protein D3C72_1715260 [compost metagenome]